MTLDPAVVEQWLRQTPWKKQVKHLMTIIEHRRAAELDITMRRWLEIDRHPRTPEAEAKTVAEATAIRLLGDMGVLKEMPDGFEEHLPIRGWVIGASHFLKDGTRWWLFTAKRHDETAALIGPTVPAPADKSHLRALHKIISFAGGNPKKELLRTGAITLEEHDYLIAEGKPEIAEYGQIWFWWKA